MYRSLWLAGVAASVCATAATAQVAPSPNTAALVAAAGINPQYQKTAAYVGALCPNVTPGTDLRIRCAAALSAAVNAPTAAREALSWLTPEELLAQGATVDGSTSSATAAVAGRLSALSRTHGGGGMAMIYRPVVLATAGDTAGLGGLNPSRLQVFANVLGGSGDKDTNILETGYSFDQRSATIGADYRFSDMLTAGVSLSYGDTDLDFDRAGGSLEAQTVAGSAYGLWSLSDRLSLTGLISYGRIDYSSDRKITYAETATSAIARVAHGDTKGDQWEGTLTLSYSIAGSDGWSYGPSLAVSGRSLDLDAFNETGADGLNLAYAKQSTDSLQLIGGFDVSKAFSTQSGIITPYARAQAIYETGNDSRTVQVRYVADTTGFFPGIRLTTSAPDRTRFLLGGGLAGQFTGGWSAYADIETVIGLRDVAGYNATLGFRKEF